MDSTLLTKALQEFASTSLKDKQAKILDLLQAFGTTHPVFGQLHQDISSRTYTDEQLTKIYKIVLESINSLKADTLATSLSKLEQLHQALQYIRQQEANFLQKEGDIDAWLDKALSTV